MSCIETMRIVIESCSFEDLLASVSLRRKWTLDALGLLSIMLVEFGLALETCNCRLSYSVRMFSCVYHHLSGHLPR